MRSRFLGIRRRRRKSVLILFDIDGTLVKTAGAGLEGLGAAGRDLHGAHFDIGETQTAGRVDPQIVGDLLAANGVTPSRAAIEAMRERYLGHLDRKLGDGRRLEVMPGVRELIAALLPRPDVALGLVTGNFREAGQLKLRHCEIDIRPFAFNAFGCDCDWERPARRQLPPVARSRHAERGGPALHEQDIVVIGDTPNDVDCARHHGMRAIAVTTGWCDRDELVAAGADAVFDDLSDTAAVLEVIGERRGL
jgi:phosphoglycolate phosphatase